MEMTTIAVTKDVKNKISEFGNKGETFSDILLKIYNAARKTQLREILMSDENCVTIEQAMEEAEKKWPK